MIKGSVKHRRHYFIKRMFQLKMILQFIVILIIGGVILGFVLYYFADNELETKLFHAHMRILNTKDILMPTIILTFISVFILVTLITSYTVLYLSHKIAGPLYKFEKVTEEIGNGNFKVNVKLRKKDELIPLQTAFENMIEKLEIKIIKFKNNFENMKNIEYRLNNAIQTSTLSETDKNTLTTKVNGLITEYKENIDAFTIKDSEPAISSDNFYCPVHDWIGKCPAFPEDQNKKES